MVPLWMPGAGGAGKALQNCPRETTVPVLIPHGHQNWSTLGRSGAWEEEDAQELGSSLVQAKVQR